MLYILILNNHTTKKKIKIDKNLNEKTCESKNKEYSLKNHLASNESYHDFDNESILMNVDNFNININSSNKNTDIYTNNSKPRSDQHSIRMSASCTVIFFAYIIISNINTNNKT